MNVVLLALSVFVAWGRFGTAHRLRGDVALLPAGPQPHARVAVEEVFAAVSRWCA